MQLITIYISMNILTGDIAFHDLNIHGKQSYVFLHQLDICNVSNNAIVITCNGCHFIQPTLNMKRYKRFIIILLILLRLVCHLS